MLFRSSLINAKISPRFYPISLHPPQSIYLKWTMTCLCRAKNRSKLNLKELANKKKLKIIIKCIKYLGFIISINKIKADLSLARHKQVIVHFKYIDCGGCRLIGRDLGDILMFIRLFRPKLQKSSLNPT